MTAKYHTSVACTFAKISPGTMVEVLSRLVSKSVASDDPKGPSRLTLDHFGQIWWRQVVFRRYLAHQISYGSKTSPRGVGHLVTLMATKNPAGIGFLAPLTQKNAGAMWRCVRSLRRAERERERNNFINKIIKETAHVLWVAIQTQYNYPSVRHIDNKNKADNK